MIWIMSTTQWWLFIWKIKIRINRVQCKINRRGYLSGSTRIKYSNSNNLRFPIKSNHKNSSLSKLSNHHKYQAFLWAALIMKNSYLLRKFQICPCQIPTLNKLSLLNQIKANYRFWSTTRILTIIKPIWNYVTRNFLSK